MARLNNTIKTAIIRALAGFESPTQVARAIKVEYGVDVSPQQVEAYDPTKRAGAGLSANLRELFLAERTKYKTDMDAIPEAHVAVRVRMLAEIANSAKDRGNFKIAMNALEGIAKEVGGAYGNTRKVELSGRDGNPVEVEPKDKIDIQKLVAEALGCLAEEGEYVPQCN